MGLDRIRVGIVGLGNCASALIQGSYFYSKGPIQEGLVRPLIGPYGPEQLDFVVGFDVDDRKIGKCIKDAIFELPNCCRIFCEEVRQGPISRFGGPVLLAPVLDGVSNHMRTSDAFDSERFCVTATENHLYSDLEVELFANTLKQFEVDILVNYLPVGSQIATEFWAEVCLMAHVNMVNCIPVFLASNPVWSQRFKHSELSIIGDDMKSQFGASVLSQMLQELAASRGHKVKVHVQQNSGGNTDFLNMINQDRLKSKKISKENVLRHHGNEPDFLHAGPSDYIRVFKDTKVAHFHLELEGFGGSPVVLDARLEVHDSPNSAGVVIDAIRYCMVAQQKGLYGAVEGPSAFTQKSPPVQMPLQQAIQECNALAGI